MKPTELTESSARDDAEPPQRRRQIEVVNETGHSIDARRLVAGIEAALQHAGDRRISVSLAVVDDATIHRLNRQFLEHDYPTDVLSFALEDNRRLLDGEIIISHDTAVREAALAGWAAADELLLYAVHGALHLAGYGDKSPADAAAMQAAEARILDSLGVARSATDSRWQANAGPGQEASPA